MGDDIVSADIFHIFSESDHLYFFKMRFNFGFKASSLIRRTSACLLADKTTENAPACFFIPPTSQHTKNLKLTFLTIWQQLGARIVSFQNSGGGG